MDRTAGCYPLGKQVERLWSKLLYCGNDEDLLIGPRGFSPDPLTPSRLHGKLARTTLDRLDVEFNYKVAANRV
jgi:hypothetical protein